MKKGEKALLVKKVKAFEMQIVDKGITVIDHRHTPPRKCGTLTWKNVMEVIEESFGTPSIYPCGPNF
jgi:hypothetical protein